MKMLGTLRWLVISWRASWIAAPSSARHRLAPRSLQSRERRSDKHTDLVELEGVVLGAERREELLGGLAVRAVGLGEDGDGIVVDDVLGLGLCGGHGCGTRGSSKEAA